MDLLQQTLLAGTMNGFLRLGQCSFSGMPVMTGGPIIRSRSVANQLTPRSPRWDHLMTSSRCLAVFEESQVGFARRRLVEICQRSGGDKAFCGKVAIVVTELACNLVLHGKGGEIVIREAVTATSRALEMLALDRGPGMRNIAECLRDGFSTAGTAGIGFGAIKRLSDRFELFRQLGRGTVVWVRLCPQLDASSANMLLKAVVSALPLNVKKCAVTRGVMERAGVLRAMVVDGFGHGLFAGQAAREAVAVFRSQATTGVASTLKLVDQALTKSRGAAGQLWSFVQRKDTLQQPALATSRCAS